MANKKISKSKAYKQRQAKASQIARQSSLQKIQKQIQNINDDYVKQLKKDIISEQQKFNETYAKQRDDVLLKPKKQEEPKQKISKSERKGRKAKRQARKAIVKAKRQAMKPKKTVVEDIVPSYTGSFVNTMNDWLSGCRHHYPFRMFQNNLTGMVAQYGKKTVEKALANIFGTEANMWNELNKMWEHYSGIPSALESLEDAILAMCEEEFD